MELAHVICKEGATRRCRGGAIVVVSVTVDEVGRVHLGRCPHCRGEVREASRIDRDMYRARLEAEAELREKEGGPK